jgi:hypothetical protein
VPETVIVTYVPGDKSELKPGSKIFIAAANKKDDGTLHLGRARRHHAADVRWQKRVADRVWSKTPCVVANPGPSSSHGGSGRFR